MIYSEKSKIAYNMDKEENKIVEKDGKKYLNGLEVCLESKKMEINE